MLQDIAKFLFSKNVSHDSAPCFSAFLLIIDIIREIRIRKLIFLNVFCSSYKKVFPFPFVTHIL